VLHKGSKEIDIAGPHTQLNLSLITLLQLGGYGPQFPVTVLHSVNSVSLPNLWTL